MEPLSPLWSVVALVVVLLISMVLQRRANRRETRPVARAVASIRMNALAFCAAALVLLFSLPSTPVLSTFGYPKTVQQISEPALMLPLLQEYNRAIVRTTEVLFWFMFMFVFVLVGSTISVISTMTAALADMPSQPSSRAEGGSAAS
jgi:hypothetical protein